jgi:inorganic phosphate transporter, PiT family
MMHTSVLYGEEMTEALLILLFLLAFANGANDNCKGVATLVGFGAAKPRQALLWATVTTALGSLFSFFFARGLIKSFSTGLFADGTPLEAPFFVAVLVGAFGWVIFATRSGLPVSTTHAITGALTGAGLVAFGSRSIAWEFLGTRFAAPLALSPLLSLLLVYALAWPVVWLVSRSAGKCACVTEELTVQPAGAGTASASSQLHAVVAEEALCEEREPVLALSGSRAANAVHWLSSGLVGFARGWNDAPKITALSLVVLKGPGGMATGFALVTAAMALGGLLAGRKVLETLSQKVTPMPLPESLTASLTTAGLVGMASWNALPVSTTHVSTGAIIGAGLKHDPKGVHWAKVGEIVLSWVITLPVAGLLAAGAMLVLR